MGWWSKAVSAVKSAVNKAVSTVKSVVSSVSSSVSKAVSSAKSAVSKVASSVKSSVSDVVKKASSSVSKVADTIKKTVSDVVGKTKDKIEDVKETARIIAADAVSKVSDTVNKIKETVEATALISVIKTTEKVEVVDWKGSLLDSLKSAVSIKLPFIGLPTFDAVNFIYTAVTGKTITEAESFRLKAKILDWIIPLNALSKLFTGTNLDGKPEEFGSVGDYADIVFALAIIVPVGKIGAVAGKLGIKAGTKLGLSGFMKFAVTKIDDAARLFKLLNVDDQAKLLGALSKTDEGVKIINLLIAKKALNPTLVKPTISIVNKAIANKILIGSGFGALVRRALRPKTIIWGLTGMLGVIGSAYGIAFGTEWFAKEGLWELYSFPITDKLRDYRFDPTPEKAERIRKEIDMLRSVLPKAQSLVRGIAWLWPPTREAWLSWADGIKFELEQIEEEFEAIIIPELVVLPETVKAIVRDIIDGDTIDTDLDAINQETGAEIKLPEYRETGHARIRIVGINAPEKSPKGEILCSDVEIVKVEKEFADESRDRLLPLNDKEVILKIDPEISLDTYNRILAVVEHNGEDIGLRQIEEGLACGYYREPHKYYDEAEYSAATLAAKGDGIGMWAGLEEIEKEEEKIKIRITSIPTNAKLFLDDVALHHNTPSDEAELSDVMHLFTLGKHVLSAEKAGLSAMEDIVIVKGDNGTIHLTLETAPIEEVPTPEEVVEEEIKEELIEKEIEEEKIEEAVVEEVEEPVTIQEAFEDLFKRGLDLAVKIYTPIKPAEIPKEYTSEQSWALNEAFAKVLELTEGRAIMSRKEKGEFIEMFSMHTEGQKEVLNLLIKDVLILTAGRDQLSADEFILLKEKYRMI